MYFCSMGISVLRPAFTWETEAVREGGRGRPDGGRVQQKLVQNVFDGYVVQRRPMRGGPQAAGGGEP